MTLRRKKSAPRALFFFRQLATFGWDEFCFQCRCTVRAETRGQTGVEMEALTAVQVGLLCEGHYRP